MLGVCRVMGVLVLAVLVVLTMLVVWAVLGDVLCVG
jgi:hypothetical protein